MLGMWNSESVGFEPDRFGSLRFCKLQLQSADVAGDASDAVAPCTRLHPRLALRNTRRRTWVFGIY
jgi:hypothetical protein